MKSDYERGKIDGYKDILKTIESYRKYYSKQYDEEYLGRKRKDVLAQLADMNFGLEQLGDSLALDLYYKEHIGDGIPIFEEEGD